MTQQEINAQAYEKALDDCARTLMQTGVRAIGSAEWLKMLDAAMALHGWKEARGGKSKAA